MCARCYLKEHYCSWYSMVEFMVSNNLLSDYQFGFVKGRSTTLQLLNVLNDWTNSLENKFTTDCIYLDYQKAFDSVPHKRLISKLQSYKFNPVMIDMIYLDFAKAFDKVDHNILLHKVKAIGIQGKLGI